MLPGCSTCVWSLAFEVSTEGDLTSLSYPGYDSASSMFNGRLGISPWGVNRGGSDFIALFWQTVLAGCSTGVW